MKKKFKEGLGVLSIANKDGDIEETQLAPDVKKKAFEEAYKKQNPEKYEMKKKLGLFN